MNQNKPFPIIPTSGGVVSTQNIVCREEIIQEYWKTLRAKSISLFAERRFGKSCVIRKMAKDPPKGFITMYKSVQAINTIDDFVETLYQYAKDNGQMQKFNLEALRKGWNALAEAIPKNQLVELGKFNTRWQKRLIFLLDKIIESNEGEILVVFLDEFSLMIDAMDEAEASVLIGFLRDIVHEKYAKTLRFVYTGSIGVDLIINKIERAGYNLGDPLNHTERKKLKAFTKDQSNYFCQCLELGCGFTLSQTVRKHIYKVTDGIPYFIDRIFDSLKSKEKHRIKEVDAVLLDIIDDSTDSNNLEHFYDRIKGYYPDVELSHELLNIVCKEDEMAEAVIVEKINQSLVRNERLVKDELNRLWRDGYLLRSHKNGTRYYKFQFSIIKRWWQLNKA